MWVPRLSKSIILQLKQYKEKIVALLQEALIHSNTFEIFSSLVWGVAVLLLLHNGAVQAVGVYYKRVPEAVQIALLLLPAYINVLHLEKPHPKKQMQKRELASNMQLTCLHFRFHSNSEHKDRLLDLLVFFASH